MKKEQVYRSFAVFNFKKFDSTADALVDFAPITFLTGANGSGKSSFVKSFVLCDKLLNDWKTQYNAKKDIILKDTVLDFTDKRLNLGSYQYVRNDGGADELTCFTYEDGSLVPHQLNLMIEAFDEDSQGRVSICQINSDNWAFQFEIQWNDFKKRFSYDIGDVFGQYLENECRDACRSIDFVKSLIDKVKECSECPEDSLLSQCYHLYHNGNMQVMTKLFEDTIKDDQELLESSEGNPDLLSTMPVIKAMKDVDSSHFMSELYSLIGDCLSDADKAAMEQFSAAFGASRYKELDQFASQWAYENLLQGEDYFDEGCNMIETALTNIKKNLLDNPVLTALKSCSTVIDPGYDSSIFGKIVDFCKKVLEHSLTPAFAGNVIYHESVHNVSRSYNHNQGDENFYHIVKQYLDRSQAVYRNEKISYSPGSFTNKWVDKFGIGEGVSVDKDGNTNSISISVRKSILDTRPLADEGLGVNCIVMMLLEIENAIMASLLDGQDKTIILEEPESHLHPRWQSMVTDVMLDAYDSYDVQFIVETHSEYMIRRSQVLARGLKPMPFDAFYFQGDAEAYSLQYQEDGHFGKQFGPGFYDETTNLIEGLL